MTRLFVVILHYIIYNRSWEILYLPSFKRAMETSTRLCFTFDW